VDSGSAALKWRPMVATVPTLEDSTAGKAYLGARRHMLEHLKSLRGSAARIPSEREWCERLNISRSTVRQALLALEVQGTIHRNGRSGWYVAPPRLNYDPCKHVPFTHKARQQGREPSWRVTSLSKQAAPSKVAAEFGIRSNRHVPRIEVVLELERGPVAVEVSYIHPDICADPDDINHDLPSSDELQRLSNSMLHYKRIRPTNCGNYVAGLIGGNGESPAINVRQWIGNDDGLIISICETIWRANALEFETEN